MRMMATAPEETAVIGDQVFTDVLGGNLAGAFTILVQPIDRVDLPHTWFLRFLERRLLQGREPTA
jgi:predicted HAD superfamily phosphohydrolase YqeG